jgi:hypothetical protein
MYSVFLSHVPANAPTTLNKQNSFRALGLLFGAPAECAK